MIIKTIHTLFMTFTFMTNLRINTNSQDRTESLSLSNHPIQQSPLVLISEINDENRLMLKTLLETWGYCVEVAENGDETIRKAQNRKPDLIIIDINLSFVDGFVTLCRIRKLETLRGVPIIFTSGHAQPEFRNLALAFGSSDFLVKPLDFDQLEKIIDKFTNLSVNTRTNYEKFLI